MPVRPVITAPWKTDEGGKFRDGGRQVQVSKQRVGENSSQSQWYVSTVLVAWEIETG